MVRVMRTEKKKEYEIEDHASDGSSVIEDEEDEYDEDDDEGEDGEAGAMEV